MEKEFEKIKKHEIIVLTDLKGIKEEGLIEYFDDNQYNYSFCKSDENKQKTEEEKKKIIIEKKNKLKNESLEIYYNLDNQKNKELESAFCQSKLKIIFTDTPKILKEGKLYTLSKRRSEFKVIKTRTEDSTKNSFTMYDTELFNKIVEIKLGYSIPFSAVQLENCDLVLACYMGYSNYDSELLIYRLKGKQYSLIQIIKESGLGFLLKYDGDCGNSAYKRTYKVDNLKAISGNRFICISNHGFKIYSINNKKKYCLILLNQYSYDIKMIHEINENKFIFFTQKSKKNSPYRSIELIELKKITKEDINKKLDEIQKYGYQIDIRNYLSFRKYEKSNDKTNLYSSEIKELIISLKLTCSIKELIKYREYNYHRNIICNIFDYVIIKNKYFITNINNNIVIFYLNNGNPIKRNEILIDGKNSLFIKRQIYIIKWNNIEDNEFILFVDKNVFIFELNEGENDNIYLKIINHSYFPNLINAEIIQKLSEKRNKFYSFNKQIEHIISLY